LTNEASSKNVTLADDGSATETVTLTQTKAGWTSGNKDAKIGGKDLPTIEDGTKTVTVKVASDGTVTLTPAK
jgi:hypothetical protein